MDTLFETRPVELACDADVVQLVLQENLVMAGLTDGVALFDLKNRTRVARHKGSGLMAWGGDSCLLAFTQGDHLKLLDVARLVGEKPRPVVLGPVAANLHPGGQDGCLYAPDNDSGFLSVAFAGTGDHIAAGLSGGVAIWNVETGHKATVVELAGVIPVSPATHLVFTHNEDLIAAGPVFHRIFPRTLKSELFCDPVEGTVRCLAAHQYDPYLAAGYGERLCIWHTESRQLLADLAVPAFDSVAFAVEEPVLATAHAATGQVTLWDVSKMESPRAMARHEVGSSGAGACAVTFFDPSDGVALGLGHTISLWD